MSRRHNRRSIRLKGYDYTQPGAYFVTICTRDRTHLFGHVVDGAMELSPYGEIVREEWFRTAVVRPCVRLHENEFTVMPNHVHGILWIVGDPVGATGPVAPTTMTTDDVHRPHGPASGSIGAIMAQFKSVVTKRINIARRSPGASVWQRNYYEHIIRNDRALHAIRRYIVDNPRRWQWDRYNADRLGPDSLALEIWALLKGDRTGRPYDHDHR